MALPHQIPPTESSTRGSRELPASHFEFSQHRHAHPATVGDECTSPAKYMPSVLFCFRAFSFTCQVADFGVGGAMTETSQAGSEDYFPALGVFFGGSSTPVWTSSKPRSTSQRRCIDRQLLPPVDVVVRRLSSPVAPIPAAAHTWPATEPHALRLRAVHPCIPPPPQDPPSHPLCAPAPAFVHASQRRKTCLQKPAFIC